MASPASSKSDLSRRRPEEGDRVGLPERSPNDGLEISLNDSEFDVVSDQQAPVAPIARNLAFELGVVVSWHSVSCVRCVLMLGDENNMLNSVILTWQFDSTRGFSLKTLWWW